jgi:hypothetical protein
VPARLVPESALDPIPESKFVIDAAKIILYDMLSRADGFGDFTVFEFLGGGFSWFRPSNTRDQGHKIEAQPKITGEFPERNEYLAAENRILRAQVQGRLLLSDAEKAALAEIAYRLGWKALEGLAAAAKPDTLLAWYRMLIAHKFDGSKCRKTRGRPPVEEESERLWCGWRGHRLYPSRFQPLRHTNQFRRHCPEAGDFATALLRGRTSTGVSSAWM